MSPEESLDGRVEAIVAACEGSRTAAPIEASTALGLEHPDLVASLARATIERCPRGGTFLDAALSYVPETEWARLVSVALDAFEDDRDNEAAESLLAYASLQAPAALHPHLERIFSLAPNASSYYAEYPWRESGDTQEAFLRAVLEDPSSAGDAVDRACLAILETRDAGMVEMVLELAGEAARRSSSRIAGSIEDHLSYVGFELEGGRLGRLTSPRSFHLVLPEDFRPTDDPPWLGWTHPTWRLPAGEAAYAFGGKTAQACLLCAEPLHRLIDLDPVPEGLGITGLPRVELATCLSCVGWEQDKLFYRHDPDGTPVNIDYDGPHIEPEFRSEPLLAAEVRLAPTPDRWTWQDWALSNSRENLHRLGGEPSWIQDADYPECPSCGRTMHHLLQLDSRLPTADGQAIHWGDDGLAYIAWCDRCKVSSAQWQCT